MKRLPAIVAFVLATFALTPLAHAHGYALGDIAIAHPFAIATPPGATTGGGYLKELSNRGTVDERLTGASSPLADRVEMHAMSMDGNVMRMRQVTAIVIPASGRVEMAPGNGYHLMLIGLKQPMKIGDKVPVRLTFDKAGTVDVELSVQERGAANDMRGH